MRYSVLGFSQEMVLGLHRTETVTVSGVQKEREVRIDITDLMILSDIADFMNRKKVIKYVIDDKTYMNVKYSIIMEDLPILGLKQQALSDRLDKLCSFSLLEKIVVKNQSGSFTAFKIGDVYEKIVYSDGEREGVVSNRLHMYPDTSAEVSRYECNIYNNNRENIYIDKDSSTINTVNIEKKEEINKFISNKKDNVYKLDLSAVSDDYMSAITTWLDYKRERKDYYKQRGFNAFYSRLRELSGGDSDKAMKIVEQSMASNYRGIFPIKGDESKKSNNLPVGFILKDDRHKKHKSGINW